MRDIWRKTARLFWERPVLWVPVLCADFLGFWLLWFQRLAAKKLIIWLLFKHSTLGGSLVPRYSMPGLTLLGVLIGGPLEWGSFFLDIGFYTMAFVMTGVMVGMISQESIPDFSLAFHVARLRLRRILGFSLKLILLCAVWLALIAVASTKFSDRPRPISGYLFGFGMGAVGFLIAAYCLTPSALLLLRDAPSRLERRESALWGRGFSIATAIAVSAIAYFAGVAERSFLASTNFAGDIPQLILNLAVSLLAAFPYIALFIALSLIEASDTKEPELVSVASPI